MNTSSKTSVGLLTDGMSGCTLDKALPIPRMKLDQVEPLREVLPRVLQLGGRAQLMPHPNKIIAKKGNPIQRSGRNVQACPNSAGVPVRRSVGEGNVNR